MKLLHVPHLKDSDFASMEKQVKEIFYRILFKPLIDILKPHSKVAKKAAREMRNSPVSVVVDAIRSGRIQYSAGIFSGAFNASISSNLRRIGAKLDKRKHVYTINQAKVPPDIISIAFTYQQENIKLHDELQARLSEIEKSLKKLVEANRVDATAIVSIMDRKFSRMVGSKIGGVDLTSEGRERISREYSENMELWIKNWTEDAIIDLRQDVEDSAREGYRFDRLVPRIQKRYGVSQTKAKFLARQETSLLISKHREVRFTEAGLTEYIWRATMGDDRTRPAHRSLNGRRFRFDDPPASGENGEKKNPGEDWGCRCVAEPVLKFGEKFLTAV